MSSSTSCCREAEESDSKASKTVRFYPHVAVQLFEGVTSVEQRYACWFQDVDYRRMHSKNVQWIRRCMAGPTTGYYCMRGLERMYGNGQASRMVRRSKLYKEIQDEQERVYEQRRDDGESINNDDASSLLAEISLRISQPAALEAHEMGLRDEYMARAVYERSKSNVKHSEPTKTTGPSTLGILSLPRGLQLVVDRAPGGVRGRI